MLIEKVERLVERFYERVQVSVETKQALSSMLHARFDEMMSEGAAELADLATRRAQLEDEQEKLLRAHYAGAVPLELLKREQDRITASLETIQNRIDAHHGEYAFARANLDDSTDPAIQRGRHLQDSRRREPPTVQPGAVQGDLRRRGQRRSGRLQDAVRRAEHRRLAGRCAHLGRRGKEVGPGSNLDQGRSLGRKFKPDPFGVDDGT